MKHALLFLLIFGTKAFAQNGWFPIQYGLPEANDLVFTTTEVGFLVGNEGFAKKSTDGGKIV